MQRRDLFVIDFISSHLKNLTSHTHSKLVLFSSIYAFSPPWPLSPFSLSRSLECILSLFFPSFVLLQLLSHLQAFLSRSRIVNSRSVSVSISAAASPLSVPARRVAQVRLLCTVHTSDVRVSVTSEREQWMYTRESIVWLAISARVPTLRGDDCFIKYRKMTDGTEYAPSSPMSTK